MSENLSCLTVWYLVNYFPSIKLGKNPNLTAYPQIKEFRISTSIFYIKYQRTCFPECFQNDKLTPPDTLCSRSLGSRTTEIQSQGYLHRETC